MRLLQLNDNGELSLIQRAGNNILEYAILSHTWGADGEEVTFKDLVKGTGKQKTGYSKLRNRLLRKHSLMKFGPHFSH
jgi:hypothetical protein